MRSFLVSTFLILTLAGCQNTQPSAPSSTPTPQATFSEARRSFTTKLIDQRGNKGDVEKPPAALFSIVEYTSKLGPMPAYLSTIPNDGKKHPAIIWIQGGFGNDIGDVWSEQPPENDQSAAVIREAGVVMMYPAQRGGNTSAGSDETCYGEVDDIIAAAEFLRKQKGIDPDRIYLGGHSTGGTKAILAAEASNVFRAVFSLGPVGAVEDYGSDYFTFDAANRKEFEMREPLRWLASLQTPVYIFEGVDGNIESLRQFRDAAKQEGNGRVRCYEIPGNDHFSAIRPVCTAIAKQILKDDKGGETVMDFKAAVDNIK